MTLAPYTPGDEDAILALFKKSFGQEMSPAYWKWRFQDNPHGRECISLMWDGEVLAGHYAVSPLVMLVEGEEVLASLSMTTMTHPDYAGRGIFTTLAEELYSRIHQQGGVAAVWGFPNNNSHYGLVKNLRWKNIGLLPTFSLPLSRLKGGGDAAITGGVQKFQPGHEQAFRNSLAFEISTLRSAAYLQWRYLDNPQHRYEVFEFREGEKYYFAVAKLYRPQNQPVEIDVTELVFPADGPLLSALFAALRDHYQDASPSRINLWLPLDDPKHLLLEKLGFANSLPLTYWGIRDFSGKLSGAEDLRRWNFSLGDSDIY
jgi:GNAT superfamily N-acetyltransferase